MFKRDKGLRVKGKGMSINNGQDHKWANFISTVNVIETTKNLYIFRNTYKNNT